MYALFVHTPEESPAHLPRGGAHDFWCVVNDLSTGCVMDAVQDWAKQHPRYRLIPMEISLISVIQMGLVTKRRETISAKFTFDDDGVRWKKDHRGQVFRTHPENHHRKGN